MAGLVYSYLRFSDPRQAAGHSSERQAAYAARWAAEHGLQLDESLTLRDEGLSAFHQAHVKRGALGAFLAAVEAGRVPEGSVLVVEGLDRLSRAEVIDAQAQLLNIINAGLSVVTASDNRVYSRESLRANPQELIFSLLIMMRAHEESATKSKRVTAAIVKQCRSWQSGAWRGKLRNGRDPSWVRETETGWELDEKRAAAVREAVQLFMAGQSARRIMDKIAKAEMSPVTARTQHLSKLLRNPALIGTKRISAGGEDFELLGYYPALVTEAEFSELQVAANQRGRRGGRTGAGDIPHIITGLGITYCGYCGCAMSGQNLFGKIKNRGDKLLPGYRRLLCAGQSYASGRCAYPKSRSVAPIEAALMDYCSDVMNLRSLFGSDRAAEARAALARARKRAAEVDQQLERLTDALLSLDGGAAPATFAKRARELESEQAQLADEISAGEHQVATLARADITGMDEQWRELAAGVAALDVDARLKARQLVADTFSRITVYASGMRPSEDPQDITDVVLVAKGGAMRVLRIGTDGRWVAGQEVAEAA